MDPTSVIGTSYKLCVDSLLIATAVKLLFDFFFHFSEKNEMQGKEEKKHAKHLLWNVFY